MSLVDGRRSRSFTWEELTSLTSLTSLTVMAHVGRRVVLKVSRPRRRFTALAPGSAPSAPSCP